MSIRARRSVGSARVLDYGCGPLPEAPGSGALGVITVAGAGTFVASGTSGDGVTTVVGGTGASFGIPGVGSVVATPASISSVGIRSSRAWITPLVIGTNR